MWGAESRRAALLFQTWLFQTWLFQTRLFKPWLLKSWLFRACVTCEPRKTRRGARRDKSSRRRRARRIANLDV
jgi:hypothetical protein